MRKSFSKTVTAVTAGAMALALTLTAIPNTASAAEVSDDAKKAAKQEFDASGEYNAYLQFQADNVWVFRDPMYNPKTGRSSENWDKVLTTLNVDDPVAVDGVVTDAVIKGNGTYTVSVTDLNGCIGTDSNTHLKIVGVTTDIPENDQIQITDVKTKIDGITKLTQDEAILDDEDMLDTKLISFLTTNTYRGTEDLSTEFVLPQKSIEVTFTVSGMAQDNPDAVEATPTPVPQTDDADDASTDDSSSSSSTIVIVVVVVVVIVAAAVIVTRRRKK